MSEPVAIVIFDGDCLLCDRSVRFLLRNDRTARYAFATTASQTGRHWLRIAGLDPQDPTSFLLVEAGRVFDSSDALLRVLYGLGGVWRASAALRIVPRVARDALYRLVARNRQRWFGPSAHCIVPDAADASRFLD